jgi:hypothetical protein
MGTTHLRRFEVGIVSRHGHHITSRPCLEKSKVDDIVREWIDKRNPDELKDTLHTAVVECNNCTKEWKTMHRDVCDSDDLWSIQLYNVFNSSLCNLLDMWTLLIKEIRTKINHTFYKNKREGKENARRKNNTSK